MATTFLLNAIFCYSCQCWEVEVNQFVQWCIALFSVRSLNPVTGILIIRAQREGHKMLTTALPLIKRILKYNAFFKSLHVGGKCFFIRLVLCYLNSELTWTFSEKHLTHFLETTNCLIETAVCWLIILIRSLLIKTPHRYTHD